MGKPVFARNLTIAALVIGTGAIIFAMYQTPLTPLTLRTVVEPLQPACVQHEFTPQKDITGFEIAFIYKNTSGYSHQVLCIDDKTWVALDPKIKRHFK